MRRVRWITATVLCLLVAGTVMAQGASAAPPPQPGQNITVSGPSTFSGQGTLKVIPGAAATATISTWTFDKAYYVADSLGYEYIFEIYLEWSGSGGKVVTNYWYNACYNDGGYFYYKGCTTSHSPFGLSKMQYRDNWTYCVDPTGFVCKHPYIQGYVYYNGSITGTIVWG